MCEVLKQYIETFDMPDDFKFSTDKNDPFCEERCIARLKSTFIPDYEMDYPVRIEEGRFKDEEDGNYVLQNGKYKGEMIKNVPLSYIKWYVNSGYVPDDRNEMTRIYTINEIVEKIQRYIDSIPDEKKLNPANYVMKIGKYKGQTLEEISKINGGIEYIKYISNDEKIYESIRNILKSYITTIST